VEGLVKKLCSSVGEKLPAHNTINDQLNISFDAYFDLVTSYPFYNGNGRTSRLLMSYLQLFFNLPMGIVFKEDKAIYFEALQQTRKQEDITVFRKFMYRHYEKYLSAEIKKFENIYREKGGGGYSFVF